MVLAAGADGATLLPVSEDGAPAGEPVHCTDVAETVARVECTEQPRWVWDSTARTYAPLLRAGVRVARCHDLALVGAILAVRGGRQPEPNSIDVDDRPGLFDAHHYPRPDSLAQRHREQASAIADSSDLRLLCAAESAGGLAAAEMSQDGLPFSSDTHDRYLRAALGPRPAEGNLPVALVELEGRIGAAFGRRVNPASHVEVVAAFTRAGIDVTSTRAHVLQHIDHPAVPLLLRYRDLSKLFSTNGWAWADAWVSGNRFRPVYVPGGVVSGRWASRGGGALQIPKPLRRSVIADPNHQLVIADAGQLEPRILAAMSRDPDMMDAAGSDDLYAPVAAAAFGGDRSKAKVAILGVLYGATAGESRSLLTLLRRRFPRAVDFVEKAARAGERGEVVHSLLGRACPPPTADWWSQGDAHARGRFTRNFVVQATASEWALCLLADLRRRLAEDPAAGELVFFQHDEVVVHSSNPDAAAEHVTGAAAAATRLL
ncbi:MAG: bifunctional 3'-5' exonuclease/DNA polymerase, partial [Rhodococcus sp. (in: high G+C Gram-positive bacteria)]